MRDMIGDAMGCDCPSCMRARQRELVTQGATRMQYMCKTGTGYSPRTIHLTLKHLQYYEQCVYFDIVGAPGGLVSVLCIGMYCAYTVIWFSGTFILARFAAYSMLGLIRHTHVFYACPCFWLLQVVRWVRMAPQTVERCTM